MNSSSQQRIEYSGWLPAFATFGDCGTHPQFDHIDRPPQGYEFAKPDDEWVRSATKLSLFNAPQKALKMLLAGIAGIKLGLRCLSSGASPPAVLRFLRDRHFRSQALLPIRRVPQFVSSIPFTYSRHPWIIEIEDITTLFFPYVINGHSEQVRVTDSPYFPIIRTLLKSDNCRAIVTHMASTAEGVKKVFRCPEITAKTFHVPMGIACPPMFQTHEDEQDVRMLFTNSWHQNPGSFYVRGGLEVLETFQTLNERFDRLELILRTKLPDDLPEKYKRLVRQSNVKLIDTFLPVDEFNRLKASCHFYLLPAARIHIMSVLQAMSFGQIPVVSNGWGMEEYVKDRVNGIVVTGREEVSWIDPASGVLRENYTAMHSLDPSIVDRMVAALTELLNDHPLRMRIAANARQAIEQDYNLDNWNRGLKSVFDRVLTGKSGS